MYSKTRCTKVNELRFQMVKAKCGEELNPDININMASLPPCNLSLQQHVNRCCYQVGVWKRAHEPTPDVPEVSECHGWTQRDGILEPLWTKEDVLILPQQMIEDLVEDASNTEEKDVLDLPEDYMSDSDSDDD